jgi:beta-mannosidase
VNPRAPRASGQQRAPFAAHWALLRVPAGAAVAPAELRAMAAEDWIAIDGPDAVAAALRKVGRWSLDAPAERFDADDWWFRAHFDGVASQAQRDLAFDGLAGLCDVWLNDTLLLQSTNMHLQHRCAAPVVKASGNELLMRFASLDRWLAQKRPRPRWRTPMVEQQQLRWARTTLLGRTPGWSPPAAPVGPWRAIEWVEPGAVEVAQLRWQARVDGSNGVVEIEVVLAPLKPGARIEQVELVLTRDGGEHRIVLVRRGDAAFHAALVVPDAALWWPHTHGEPALYAAHLCVRLQGDAVPTRLELGHIGFRTIALDTAAGDFSLRVNGVPVFCRGACWTPLDVVSLKATAQSLRTALVQVRDAGMNMLRISGTMVYEDDAFFDACDALGILVWQDFMFANMDYPADDPAFAASVRAEATQQLERWQARASLAVLCGNSEVAQQAAMWGRPSADWSQPLFDHDLAELAAAHCPQVPYWPSSAHGGAFPHRNDSGTTAYYGVGAYRRPLSDARRAGLRFATECLAFANLPSSATLARVPGDAKARTPRDLGAGWDFDDVRDHYLQQLYGIEPTELRREDPLRYLALSRAVGAEVAAAAFAEWRRAGSGCRGALVWFLRDLWAGAGWGLLDDRGLPKAAWHGCRRALAPVALFISDEGTNGLDLHLVNDPGRTLAAEIEVALYRDDGLLMERAVQTHTVAGHGALALPLASWFDRFIDLSQAYRFGPAEYAWVVATLRDATGCERAQAFHFTHGLPSRRGAHTGLRATATLQDDGSALVQLATRVFAQSIHFDVPGFVAQDEYFHLAPGAERVVRLVPAAPDAPDAAERAHRHTTGAALTGQVAALNASAPTTIAWP